MQLVYIQVSLYYLSLFIHIFSKKLCALQNYHFNYLARKLE